jgi:hypothetical protein
MNRISLWLSAALLTFIIGVAGAWLWFHQSHGQKANTLGSTPIASESGLPELSFCQIVAKPEEYEGKVIRLRGIYSFGIHGATIGDRSCLSAETQPWVSLTPAMWDEVTRAMENAYGMKNVSGALDMMAVGRFERHNPSHSSDT